MSLLISTFHRMGIESTAIYIARKKDLLNSEKKNIFFSFSVCFAIFPINSMAINIDEAYLLREFKL